MLTIHAEEKDDKVLIPKKEFDELLFKLKTIEPCNVVHDDFSDLVETSSKSTDFWMNDVDDEVWNNA